MKRRAISAYYGTVADHADVSLDSKPSVKIMPAAVGVVVCAVLFIGSASGPLAPSSVTVTTLTMLLVPGGKG